MTRHPIPRAIGTSETGFSLMELAVVLMIIGTLMSGVLVAVSQSTENARITNVSAQLREIEAAIYGYAQTYGRLPCPATVPPDAQAGAEEPLGGGVCTVLHGFVPVNTLGLYGSTNSDGLLLDPWQNPIRYSVAAYEYLGGGPFTDDAGVSSIFSTPAALSDMIGHADMLSVCNTAACDDVIYTDSAPAVVLSMGANWADYSSAEEQENAGDGTTTLTGDNTYNVTDTNTFVKRTYSEEFFDDQVIWLSPYLLFNKLIDADKLP
jgi:prepilin-type N-terminal cleavage/methylation domain-containing protein